MHDKNAEIRKVCDNTLDIIAVSINCFFSPFLFYLSTGIGGVMVGVLVSSGWVQTPFGSNQRL